jgi:UDPglucose 6-dehydrogenase
VAELADAVLVLTEWKEYLELDPVPFGHVVAKKRVLDARNALDRQAWTAAGWSYLTLGRRGG